jgi:hypothetical protein
MNTHGPSSSLGSGLGRAERNAALALDAAVAAWDASVRLVGWVARGGRLPGANVLPPYGPPGAMPADSPGEPSTGRRYAPSTVLRYRQVAALFAAWDRRNDSDGCTPSGFGRFLAGVAAGAGHGRGVRAGGRQDPRHLALLRTTICAVRATIDRPMGLELTASLRLPPRAQPGPASDPSTVAALRRAVRDRREKLLVILSCDMGLRPGRMAELRWGEMSLDQGRACLRGRAGASDIAIPAPCVPILTECAQGHALEDFLFPSPQCGEGMPTTVRTLQNALRRLVARAGAAPETSFSSLRKAASPAGGARAACSGQQPGQQTQLDGRRREPSPDGARALGSALPPTSAAVQGPVGYKPSEASVLRASRCRPRPPRVPRARSQRPGRCDGRGDVAAPCRGAPVPDHGGGCPAGHSARHGQAP